jgi:lipopolysaccharide transport system ATP-binding protein
MAVIKVEHLYKQYRLGLVGTGTLTHDLNRWWYKVRGLEDPYEKITVVNKRAEKSDSEYVWALEDINFEVNQGEVLGIIGKNGAGKSTLLKILSKVTGPTKGDVKVKGRIASLLEVGTGFHPDLTGRDNIFLNGAILGMTKSEIKSKFDEIVAFSGVEKYIDTPVKRYSSGMYVRLAFAVAAHLEPEILIVDEVLAVGDAEFQKKCLGKMKDVSNEGRTVLFVSHNMNAMLALCTRGMLLKHGRVVTVDNISNVTSEYLFENKNRNADTKDLMNINVRHGNGAFQFSNYYFLDTDKRPINKIISGQSFYIGLTLLKSSSAIFDNIQLHLSVKIKNEEGISIFHLSNTSAMGFNFKINSDVNKLEVLCLLEKIPLPSGTYWLDFFASNLNTTFDHIEYAGKLEISDGNFFGNGRDLPSKYGICLIKNSWILNLD